MKFKQFIVDAFTDYQFGGNPAAVCLLQEELPIEVMQKIAAENRLAETAFLLPHNNGEYHIKWFTPRIEMDLCGHATLAAAHVLWYHMDHSYDKIRLHSNSGLLEVIRKDDHYVLDFPSRITSPSDLPDIIQSSLNIQPTKVLKSRDYVLVYERQKQIEDLFPHARILDAINLDPGGIVVTAPGDEVDFVSRFFTPQDRYFEDPVTGSAHCSLIPYWSKELNKDHLEAYQLSKRRGTLYCSYHGNRVHIGGKAKTFAEATVSLELPVQNTAN